MSKRIQILGAIATVQDNGVIMVENEPSTLPDPNITGPCEVRASLMCDGAGRQRYNPMDMAQTETSFRAFSMICQPCYDHKADAFIALTHGRPA